MLLLVSKLPECSSSFTCSDFRLTSCYRRNLCSNCTRVRLNDAAGDIGRALFLLFNYLCAKGALPWGPGIDQSDIVLAFIILLSNAGRVLGVDRFLHKRFPKVPVW
jgi:hypothetical protein